jgi:hypothetical protein
MGLSEPATPEVTMRSALLSLAVSLLMAAPAVMADVIRFDPSKPHLMLMGEYSELRLYEQPDFTGTPGMKLDTRGLEVNGKLVCTWVGGDLDDLYEPSALLEPVNAPGKPCAGYPIISTWGEEGAGTSALYIEISDREGERIAVKYNGKMYHLNISGIPVESWQWLASAQEQEQALHARIASALKDEDFQRFVEQAHRCAEQADPSTCLPSLLAPSVYVSLLDANVTAARLTKQAFSKKNTAAAHSGQLWNELKSCFTNRPEDASADFVTLPGIELQCEVTRTEDGWRIQSLFAPVGC